MTVKFSFQLLSISTILVVSTTTFSSAVEPVPSSDWSYIQKQLELKHFSKSFIESMKTNYEEKDFEEVVRLNVLLFLKKADYHGPQVTPEAGHDVQEFCEANKAALTKAEKEFKVPGSVVASLLFMESRYGKNLGHFHVPSVYLDLLEAPRKDVQNYLQSQAERYAERITPKQRKEIRERTHRKFDFAIGELKSLQKAFQWKWSLGKEFRGSYSGAFGMAQFIPSSYVRWARANTKDEQPNLDHAEDAIMSVAYYLHSHGWKSSSRKAKIKALMKYNNSVDYARAILALAGNEQILKQ
jgi:membrane-bound lytic murein transglycosylase B